MNSIIEIVILCENEGTHNNAGYELLVTGYKRDVSFYLSLGWQVQWV